MFASVLLALTCYGVTAGQRDDLHASMEATPTEFRLGDVVFARVSLTNKAKEPVMLQFRQFSRLIGNLSLELSDRKRDTTFTLRPDVSGTAGVSGLQELKPGETWLVGYELVKMPSLECTEWPFWDAQKLSKEPYDFWGTLGTREFSVGFRGPPLSIRPRREMEMAKLLELCRDRPDAWRKLPANFDRNRPNMNWFGFTFAPPECSTSENLAALEKVLSPGSLRDIVHLTRLAQAVYDEKNVQQRRKNLADLCAWLEILPELERNWMAMQVVTWAAGNKGLGLFGFQVATEGALRLQAGDRDPHVRRFHESRGIKAISENPLAAPYLKDFRKRLKVIERRLEERRNQRDLQSDAEAN